MPALVRLSRQRQQHLLVDFHDLLIQHIRHLDLQVEDRRPRLRGSVCEWL